jgi:hypothetical protein
VLLLLLLLLREDLLHGKAKAGLCRNGYTRRVDAMGDRETVRAGATTDGYNLVVVLRHYHGRMARVMAVAVLIGTVDKADVLDVVLVLFPKVLVLVLVLGVRMRIGMSGKSMVVLLLMMMRLPIAERGRLRTLTGYGLVVCADGAAVVGQWLAHRCILTISHVGIGASGCPVGSVGAASQPGRSVTHVAMCVACRCTFRWLLLLLFQSGLVSSYQRRRLLESLPGRLMLIRMVVLGMAVLLLLLLVLLLVFLGVRRDGILAFLVATISLQILEEPPRMGRRAVSIWRIAM